ncbi:hypothetical protein Tco_0863850 [Tanacetum coccineum]
MDENTVRLWLRDHQGAVEKLAQQHATAFQAQFDTLQAELQETRGLLQNRQGARVIKGRCYRNLCGWTFPNFQGTIQIDGSLPLMNSSHCLILSLINICGLWVLTWKRELLVSNPTTMVDVFSLARSTEAYFEAIAHKEKETAKKAQTIKETTDTITSL